MKSNHSTILAVIAFLLLNTNVSAQPCLSAKPAPDCRSFFITEFGYGYKVGSPLKQRHFSMIDDSITQIYEHEITGRHLLSSELGIMRNLDANYSLGATHFFGWDIGNHFHGGAKLRLRKWFSDKASLDLSAGALLWSTESSTFEYPGFVGGASLNFGDWESVNLTITALRTRSYQYSYRPDYEGAPNVLYREFTPAQRDLSVYLGYKFSSKPGLVFNAAALTATSVIVVLVLTALPYD